MTSTTPDNSAIARGADTKTFYVILRRLEGHDESIWQADPEPVKALSGDVACRQWAEKHAKDGAELVAVPSRSFQIRKVKVETSTKVTLG